MCTRSRTIRLAAFLAAIAAAPAALCQAFPTKPLRLIVTYTPGGPADAMARAVAGPVGAALGQPVLVDNRPGASTFIGMTACAKAAPDGHTMCLTTSDSLSYNPFLFTRLPYDPERDFVGITQLVETRGAILAGANMPFKDLKEMAAYTKANPGKLNFGSFGAGSIAHLYMEWHNRELGANMTHVVYKGAAPVMAALLANEVQITYLSLGTVMGHIKSGKLKALAVTGSRRSSELPDVPTLSEQRADPRLVSYFGLYAPAQTPPSIVERLNAEFVNAMKDPKVQGILAGQRFEVVGSSVAEFNRFMKADRETAGKILPLIGIKPQEVAQ